jgi:hypothetical protein
VPCEAKKVLEKQKLTHFETVIQTQIGAGGRVNSRWLQAPDLDLFSGFSLVVEPRSV